MVLQNKIGQVATCPYILTPSLATPFASSCSHVAEFSNMAASIHQAFSKKVVEIKEKTIYRDGNSELL